MAIPRTPLIPRSDLAALGEALRAQGQRIVFTNGCFDLLHVGHARYLAAARALGDALVVGVNTDESVRRLKGPGRPLVPETERAELLAALRAVDYVTLFPEATPEAVIALLRPDMHVKGGDYRLEDLPEAEAVRRGGGRVVLLPFTEGRSTTSLVERIREATRT
jgi:D-beta-D-heptose 7-phosphate kinase/D-beta-D-heptose 1-phosphate adenosyltransferase